MHCQDQSGIIAAVSNFIAQHKGNIIYIDQHVDHVQNIFFMRLESQFDSENLDLDHLKDTFKDTLVQQFGMKWRIYTSEIQPKMAIFVWMSFIEDPLFVYFWTYM